MKINYGKNSNKNSTLSCEPTALHPFKMTPQSIYNTPISTASFIFNELKTLNSLEALYHIGSIPIG